MANEEIAACIPAGDDTEPRVKAVLDSKCEEMDGRTQWYWLVTTSGDVFLGCYPTGSVYEEISDTVWDDVNTYAGDSIRGIVTHEKHQRLLLDP